MSFNIKRFAPVFGAMALALGAAFAPHALAQTVTAPAVAPDTVVARLGNAVITEADLAFAAEDLAEDLARMPPEEQRAFVLWVLVDMKLMSEAAREAGMDETSDFRLRLSYLEDRALRRAYFTEMVSSAVTEEAIKAVYDAAVVGFVGEEEIRARHILVNSEAHALELRAALEAGGDFAELARANSSDSGGLNGGDLGYFSRGMMVPEFEAAAFALTEIGEVSQPVQSSFGWHLIKLEDRRTAPPPPMDMFRDQLAQQVMIDAFDRVIMGLMEGVEVEIDDPELAAAYAAQQAAVSGQ